MTQEKRPVEFRNLVSPDHPNHEEIQDIYEAMLMNHAMKDKKVCEGDGLLSSMVHTIEVRLHTILKNLMEPKREIN